MTYRHFVLAAIGLIGLGCVCPVCGAEELDEKLLPLLRAHEGKVACAVLQLKTGESFEFNADLPMPTASLIKLPVMVEAYRQADAGKVDLQKMITLREAEKVPGSGILTPHFSAGATIPLVDAIHLMIVYSDNTATNLVLDQIGLPATNAAMEALKLTNTKIHSQVFRGQTSILPERSKEFGLGSTTAGEMVSLLAQLEKGTLASKTATKAMRGHLAACEDKRLSRHFPPEVRVLQKTGSVSGVRTAAGIIELSSGNVALCILTSDNKDRRWSASNAAEVLTGNIGKIVLEHYEPNLQVDPKGLVLKIGSQGPRVEQLQRALNEKLKPAPELNVDGEFGPITQAAVIQWQKSQKLLETGEIDSAGWQALGLQSRDEK